MKEPTSMRNTASCLGWIVALLALASPASALLDPAASYCQALGYDMEVVLTAKGEKVLCTLSDGRVVDGWQFYSGKVALDASYCARQGLAARHVENPEICHDCSVCVLPDETVMRVIDLMGLDLRETTCGDGRCVNGEDHDSCVDDCPSGGQDSLCDQLEDGRCDLDCVAEGEEAEDADCSRCTGDCDWSGAVSISELIRGVNISLGRARLPTCEVFDTDGNETVAINELIQGVNAALRGC
jgi:putative hemolysin